MENSRFKFRAFNTTTKRMVDLNAVTPLALDPALNGQLEGVFIPFKAGYEIMQFTGLADKNGVMIFEGDIVQYTQHPGYLMNGFVAEIVWDNMSASFACHNGGSFGMWHFTRPDELQFDVLSYMEIIGNIYENKELLEVK